MSTQDIYFDPMWDIRMTDTSLRDGSHHKRHQFTKDEVGAIVAALDAAGVPVILDTLNRNIQCQHPRDN